VMSVMKPVMMPAPIDVFIADDHPVLRAGLKQIVETDPRIRVVGEAGNGLDVLERLETLMPHIVVLDIDMPGLDGFGVLREMRKRGMTSEVIVLTFHDDEEFFGEAMDLGAKGYILKESAVGAIAEGIREVAAGHHYVTPSLTALLLRRRTRAQELEAREPGLAGLTPAERRILQLIARGETSKEIAEQLSIHYRTVENHRLHIAQKLGLNGHNAVLKFALRHRSEL
jgi:two-component system, NarL family, nitrate/nitrite response regulator NarL